jgi:hypothetical protein
MGVKLDLLLWEKNINYDCYNKVPRKVHRSKKDEVQGPPVKREDFKN